MHKLDTTVAPNGHVLVVDDDPLVASTLGNSLRREGFTVSLASSMQAALEAFEQHPPDVVLTDLVMPGGSGLELKLELEQHDPMLPIVIITADDSRDAIQSAVRCRAFDYLTKPVTRVQLVSVTHRALAARRSALLKTELREEMRQQHQLRNEILSVLFDHAAEAVLIWDEHGKICDASHRAERLFGESVVELQRRTLDDIFEPHPSEGSMRIRFQRLIQHKDGVRYWQGAVNLRRRDEPARPARLSLSLCEIAENSERPHHHRHRAPQRMKQFLVGLVSIDTAHEELSRQLQQSERLANTALLAGSAAHEIKNDLGPLVGCLSMLEVDYAPSSRMIQMMQGSVRRIQEHIDQILQPLRPRPRPTAPKVLLSHAVAETLEDLRRAGTLRRIDCQWHEPGVDDSPESSVPAAVFAHPDQLHQIITNLVTNAADALGDGDGRLRGTIAITIRSEAQHALLEVRDTGEGISEELRHRVFERFFTTKERGGTGLGLPVVQDIVRNLRGQLTFESELGIGTTVRVHLPIAPGDETGALH